MIASRLQGLLFCAMVAASAPFAAGCTVEEPVYAEGYAPQYYDGYVVYYDTYGRPYYYTNGGVYYVPRTYARYEVLTNHYRTYREPYGRWNTRYGYRYRGTRYYRR
jgi:hypothetical protein